MGTDCEEKRPFWQWVEDGIAATGAPMLEKDGTRTGLYYDAQNAEMICWYAAREIALSHNSPSAIRKSLDACGIVGPEREASIVVCESLERLDRMARDLAELFRRIRPEKYKGS